MAYKIAAFDKGQSFTSCSNLKGICALFCVMMLSSFSYASTSFTCAGSVIRVLDSNEAARKNSLGDEYTHELTPFDLSIRLNKESELNESDYLDASAHNVRNWPLEEQNLLKQAFAEIETVARTQALHLHLPDTLDLIKSTCMEEFGAEGYTRKTRIILNTVAEPISTHLVAHELWHVISRYNIALRNKVYSGFGFKPCNRIDYKSAMHNRVITNPDCPFLEHYANVLYNGKELEMTLVLYSKITYQSGRSLFDYIHTSLLEVEGDAEHKHPVVNKGEPRTYELDDVPDFMKQIGTNTPYMLHIEEVAAEHFAALMAGKVFRQMSYVDKFKICLQAN